MKKIFLEHILYALTTITIFIILYVFFISQLPQGPLFYHDTVFTMMLYRFIPETAIIIGIILGLTTKKIKDMLIYIFNTTLLSSFGIVTIIIPVYKDGLMSDLETSNAIFYLITEYMVLILTLSFFAKLLYYLANHKFKKKKVTISDDNYFNGLVPDSLLASSNKKKDNDSNSSTKTNKSSKKNNKNTKNKKNINNKKNNNENAGDNNYDNKNYI